MCDVDSRNIPVRATMMVCRANNVPRAASTLKKRRTLAASRAITVPNQNMIKAPKKMCG